jgi:hypothetical protein
MRSRDIVTDTDSLEEQLRQARQFVQLGLKTDALTVLMPILQMYPTLSEAWWLAAQSMDDLVIKKEALQRVLQFVPAHADAQRLLNQVNQSLLDSVSMNAVQDGEITPDSTVWMALMEGKKITDTNKPKRDIPVPMQPTRGEEKFSYSTPPTLREKIGKQVMIGAMVIFWVLVLLAVIIS